MIEIILPDGNRRQLSHQQTGADIAQSISEGLLKNSLAYTIDDVVKDLYTPIDKSGSFKILTTRDPEGLEIYRHSTAHIMAYAVYRLFPDAKIGIGPVIEDGFYYDFDDIDIYQSDFEKIEKEMQIIIKEALPFERKVYQRDEIMTLFKTQSYKQEILKGLPIDEVTTCYTIGDGFLDLCRGPHIPNTSYIKSFKLLRLAGAYWKGNSDNKMLTRIYATAFPDKKQLRVWLKQQEEARERDHIKLGKDLGLFVTDKDVGQGLPLLSPKGTVIKQVLQRFIEDEEKKLGYQHTMTPLIAKSDLYKISGHWQHYKDGMFIIDDESEQMALRPMTCPFHFKLYNSERHSYRDLPVRYAETSTLFRNESSGEMHGLTRVRQFTLSDGHIICRLDQLEKEFLSSLKLVEYVMSVLELKNYTFRFSKWDPRDKKKYIDNPKAWEESQRVLKNILLKEKIDFVEAEGEAAFYGPKLDIQMKNVWGKEDTAITIQIDFALPEKFNMKYVDANQEEKTPLVIHRSSIGCYERTIALLIENWGGKFPFWLAPEQIVIMTVSDNVHDYAKEVHAKLLRYLFRAKIDQRAETLKKKVRDAQLQKIPIMLTLGEKEKENKTLALRTLNGEVRFGIKLDDFLSKLQELERSKAKNIHFKSD